MTREEAKKLFTVNTNGRDEWIRVPVRTYEKMIDLIYDTHEAELTKACEILEDANLEGIDRHFAECKTKDERIAELEAKLAGLERDCSRFYADGYEGA